MPAQATAIAPSTGPSSVVRPPIATPMSIPIEGTMPTSFGETMPTIGTNSAPAMPGHERCDHERDGLDVRRVVAEEAHPLLGVAAGHQQLAVAADHELAGEREHQQQHACDAMKNSICWFTGSESANPKKPRKLFRPVDPPVPVGLPISRIANAAARAWDRIAK